MLSQQSMRLKYYLQHVTTIQVPFTLEEMKTNVDTKALESICDNELGKNAPAQCISGKYVDANKKPILCYFGNRIREPKHKSGVSLLFPFNG